MRTIHGRVGDIIFDVPHVEAYVSSASATTISDTTSWFDVAGTFTNNVTHPMFAMTASGGRLTYNGPRTRMMWVHASVGAEIAAGANNLIACVIAKNGTAVAASEVDINIVAATTEDAFSLATMLTLATGDYVNLQVKNTTGTNNITLDHAIVTIIALPNDMTRRSVP